MLRGRNSRSLIGQRIYVRSFALLLVLFLAFLSTYAIVTLRMQNRQELEEIDELIRLVEPNLVYAAWQINENAANVLLESLVAHRSVVSARYSDSIASYEAKSEKASPNVWESCSQTISRTLAGTVRGASSLVEGEFELCVAQKSLSSVLLSQSLPTALPALVLAMLAAFVPFRIVQSNVVAPIKRLTDVLRSGEAPPRVDPDRRKSAPPDEIDLLYHELHERTQKLETERSTSDMAFTAMRDGIAITDAGYRIIRSNPALRKILTSEGGSFPDDILMQSFSGALNAEFGVYTEIVSDAGSTLEVGREHLPAEGGETRFLIVVRDLTARKEMEMQTLQIKKMQSLGTLSGGVAHDFNNLLAVIHGNTELLELGQFEKAEQTEFISEIKRASQRGVDLVQKLLTFARQRRLERKLVSVDEVVDDAISLAKRTLGTGHTIQLNLYSCATIFTDKSTLEASILNLITNARDAMPDGGTINVSTRSAGDPADPRVCIEVQNFGEVIPERILARMAEPFYTTKPPGKGTGLGLAMVSGFLEAEDGRLEITSDVTNGTRVRMIVTAVELDTDVGAPSETPTAAFASGRDKPRILLVDDMDDVRRAISNLLIKMDCHVTGVRSLSELKAFVFDNDVSWDIVVCDVVLDGCYGLDVYEFLERQKYSGAFYFMSGNVPEMLVEKIDALQTNGLLQKPLRRLDLAEILAAHTAEKQFSESGHLRVVK